MNFSKILIAGILAGFLAASCSKKEGQFTVSGKITHAEGQMLYLEELQVAATTPVDSVKINKKGEFEFKGETRIPTYYLLKFA